MYTRELANDDIDDFLTLKDVFGDEARSGAHLIDFFSRANKPGCTDAEVIENAKKTVADAEKVKHLLTTGTKYIFR